ELRGQVLRLLEKALRLHGGLDSVEYDSDTGGQLLEKRRVQRGEIAQRRQLDHRLHLVLEEHGEHDDAPWHGLEQSGADRDGRRRQVRDQTAGSVDGALPDQTLAERERVLV